MYLLKRPTLGPRACRVAMSEYNLGSGASNVVIAPLEARPFVVSDKTRHRTRTELLRTNSVGFIGTQRC